MPTCTVIKTGTTISSSPSTRVEELKSLIGSINIPVVTKAGDIVFYDSEKAEKVIVSYATWSADTGAYSSSRYTPIGVMVIPKSHNVYGTGEGAMMSLKYMSYSSPDSGSTSGSYIYWGEYDHDLDLTNYNELVSVGTASDQYTTAQGESDNRYLPSDKFSATACLTDPTAYYYGASYNAAPSPYLENGSRNPVYYQTTSPTSANNALSDFSGASNTEYLINLDKTQSGWKTASTITNNDSQGYTPAACCCWRYSTAGTKQGDWYLPACGEAGYIVARAQTINNTLTALQDVYGSNVAAVMGDSDWYWTSSEYSSINARDVYLSNGTVNNYAKDGDDYVRSFCRVW